MRVLTRNKVGVTIICDWSLAKGGKVDHLMTNRNIPARHDAGGNAPQLGVTERALLDSVGNATLRQILIKVVQTKMRLQFTGWLQYLVPALVSLAFLLVGGLSTLVRIPLVATLFLVIGGLLLVVTAFDLVTVKFRLRPPEPLPKRNDSLDLFDLMRARHSCRSFQTRRLTSEHCNELMASVRLHSRAPQIGNAPIRFEYIAAPLTVWPVVNATEFLIAIVPKEYDRLSVIDVGRSLQKIVMDATRMGLGTCWIGPGADHASILKYLGERYDPAEDHIICVCAVGYESWFTPLFLRIFNASMHRRLPLSSLFFADPQCTEPLDLEADPFNRFERNYEICQWAPSSYNGQTTRCVGVVDKTANHHARRSMRFDFYAATASRYYAAVALGIWCANWQMGCEALDIPGWLSVLSAEERDAHGEKTLPRYDVSWVLDGDRP